MNPRLWALACTVLGVSAAQSLEAGVLSPREFAVGAFQGVDQLPSSRLRVQLEQLPFQARDRAVRWLAGAHFTAEDLGSLEVDTEGGIYYADDFQLAEVLSDPSEGLPPLSEAAVPVDPLPAALVFHSRPGAPNVLFLNFQGEQVTGTAWNTSLSRTSIPAVALSTDSDFTTFSDAEQLIIRYVWQRVAEDYAPFDVDVTTERPATFDNRTGHALITRNTDADGLNNPSSGSGGVAYLGVFGGSGYSTYRPAWIYYNNLGQSAANIAEAVSHELGHNMGLSHDGKTDGTEYYGGHGSGEISWGPIMGTGYGRNVSQWSKGEYYLANNTQDDLATIAGKLAYRVDDHGNTPATATYLTLVGGTNLLSTTPETDPDNTQPANKGVLERSTDVDVFAFVTGNGNVSLRVSPRVMVSSTRGGNLDVLLELRDEAGGVIATNNPATGTAAQLDLNLNEGLYYLYVRGSGAGDPLSSVPTGFTTYGSVGQYFISGQVVASGYTIPPQADLQVTDVVRTGAGPLLFTVSYSDNLAIDVATIGDGDLEVSGPSDYSASARFVGVDLATDGTPRLATYAVDPPQDGIWTEANNGVYSIGLLAGQVQDTEGSWAAARVLGQFNVRVPHRVYVASMDTNPGWTLDPLWAYGAPAYASNGPTGGASGSQILAYNLSGAYENRLATKYAVTPPIDCTGLSQATLRFQRWLRLRSGDTANIQYSVDDTNWKDLWSTNRTVAELAWHEVELPLPAEVAGSPAVRLRWGLASNSTQTDLGWNLDDVEIFGTLSADHSAPEGRLTVTNILTTGVSACAFQVLFADDTAVRLASLGSSNVRVEGPNGYSRLATFGGADLVRDSSPVTADYSVTAPSNFWQAADNGVYVVTLLADQVYDTVGNAAAETLLGAFLVAVPPSNQALLVDPTDLVVPEGSSVSFTVRLAEAPLSDIVVSVGWLSGDTDLAVQSGAGLVFNSQNWAVPAVVEIAAAPDADAAAGVALFECQSLGLATVNVSATEQEPPQLVQLSVAPLPLDGGTVSPTGGVYVAGSTVQLLATPAPYFRFAGWSGGYTGVDNPTTVALDSDLAVEAVFRELLTTNYAVPYQWLASFNLGPDFESAVLTQGANGIPIWQSYIAGLDPTDPASQLQLRVMTAPDGPGIRLEWLPQPGRAYTVLRSANPGEGYTPIAGATNLPPTTSSWTNLAEGLALHEFYRLQVSVSSSSSSATSR